MGACALVLFCSLNLSKCPFIGEISYRKCGESRGKNKKMAIYDGKRLQSVL